MGAFCLSHAWAGSDDLSHDRWLACGDNKNMSLFNFSFAQGMDRWSTAQQIQQALWRLRWLSVAGMSALVFLAGPLLHVEVTQLPLLLIAAGLCLFNLMQVQLTRLPGFEAGLSPWIQLLVDLLAWMGFIFWSGGATNPLISVLLPLVAIAAAMLPAAQAWALGSVAIAGYTVLWQFYQPFNILEPQWAIRLHLLGMWLTFAVSVLVGIWFISSMTDAVRKRDLALAAAREKHLRNEWIVSLGTLAAGAAHEMSTPLATVSLLLESLQAERADDVALQEDLHVMARQLDACKNSLNRLSQQAGQTRADQQVTYRVDHWLQQLVNGWQSLQPQHNLLLRPDQSLQQWMLHADPSLASGLYNLVENALSVCRESVILRAECDDKRLTIQILDDGPGMPVEVLKAMAQHQPVESQDGMGIGLQLTRAAIERWGGVLRYFPREGGGTIAYISIPASQILWKLSTEP